MCPHEVFEAARSRGGGCVFHAIPVFPRAARESPSSCPIASMLTFNRLRPPRNARSVARATRHIRSRNASSTAQQPTVTLTARRIAVGSALALTGTLFAVYYFDSRSAIHRYLLTPALRYALDPETSHRVAVKVLRSGWAPRDVCEDNEKLRATVRPYWSA